MNQIVKHVNLDASPAVVEGGRVGDGEEAVNAPRHDVIHRPVHHLVAVDNQPNTCTLDSSTERQQRDTGYKKETVEKTHKGHIR